MSDNIIEFQNQKIDHIPDMLGPDQAGWCSVIIDNHVIPNMLMREEGDNIELRLDYRMIWIFPRDMAYSAASFAATAMAIGAGHPHYTAKHQMHLPYGTPCSTITMDAS